MCPSVQFFNEVLGKTIGQDNILGLRKWVRRSKIISEFNLNMSNGLFTLPDSDSDSKPYGYIVLCRSFHIGSYPHLDPCTESFPNCYCTHFRDRYLSWGQISVPIPYISIRGSESGSEPMWNFCIVQESESEFEFESESGNVNEPLRDSVWKQEKFYRSESHVLFWAQK